MNLICKVIMVCFSVILSGCQVVPSKPVGLFFDGQIALHSGHR